MDSKGGLLSMILAAALLVWVALLITGKLPIKVFLVQSGSMEPSIMTGDVIAVKAEDFYSKGDVVTFKDSTSRIVTHRIVESKSGDNFVSKGDANKDSDRESVRKDQIIGKVMIVIPKVGYLVNFSKSLPGLILLVLLPAGFLVVSELTNIAKEVGKKK